MNINLHIKRLVIDGISIDPHRLDALKCATQCEIATQLRTHGLGSSMASQHMNKPLDGGRISISNTLEPGRIGRQIGKAVFRGIKK